MISCGLGQSSSGRFKRTACLAIQVKLNYYPRCCYSFALASVISVQVVKVLWVVNFFLTPSFSRDRALWGPHIFNAFSAIKYVHGGSSWVHRFNINIKPSTRPSSLKIFWDCPKYGQLGSSFVCVVDKDQGSVSQKWLIVCPMHKWHRALIIPFFRGCGGWLLKIYACSGYLRWINKMLWFMHIYRDQDKR